jgi:hypothetical protein
LLVTAAPLPIHKEASMNNSQTRAPGLFHAILPILGTFAAFAALIGVAPVLGAAMMMMRCCCIPTEGAMRADP